MISSITCYNCAQYLAQFSKTLERFYILISHIFCHLMIQYVTRATSVKGIINHYKKTERVWPFLPNLLWKLSKNLKNCSYRLIAPINTVITKKPLQIQIFLNNITTSFFHSMGHLTLQSLIHRFEISIGFEDDYFN